jgi:pyrophosphatase PpaX
LIFASFNYIAKKYLGKVLAPREIISLFGPPEEGALLKLLGGEKVAQAMDELCDFYRSHHHLMASVHRGVDDTLRYLKERHVNLALFTGKGRRTTTITLDALDLTRYFDLIVSGNDVVRHKPHPEGIQKVMAAFSTTPTQVLMVGDALSDVKASRAAGVRMAGVLWDSFDRERMLQANTEYVFHTVDEMQTWFHKHVN